MLVVSMPQRWLVRGRRERLAVPVRRRLVGRFVPDGRRRVCLIAVRLGRQLCGLCWLLRVQLSGGLQRRDVHDGDR